MYYFYNLNTKIFCNLNKTLRQYLLQVRSDIEAMERLTKLKIKQLFFSFSILFSEQQTI